MAFENRQRLLIEVAKELKVGLNTHNNEPSRVSITRLGTIKFYDAIKNFGYVIDTLEGKEYYFTMNISDSFLIRDDVRSRIRIQNTSFNAPTLNADDTVSLDRKSVV